MINPAKLDIAFKRFIKNLPAWVHDGIIPINISLLQSFGLLKTNQMQKAMKETEELKRYFYIIETPEKITLFNEEFSIWIVPTVQNNIPLTYVLVALNRNDEPHPELVFSASGVYNISNIILNVLECFLKEIQENEKLLKKIDRI